MRRIRTAYRSQNTDRILGAGLLFDTWVVVANFRCGGLSARIEIMPGEWVRGQKMIDGSSPARTWECNLLERRMGVMAIVSRGRCE